MTRSFFAILLATSRAAAAPAVARDSDRETAPQSAPALTVTGVTLASQYRLGGISPSDEQVALQGTAGDHVDTNLGAAEAALGGATRDIVDGAVVATLTASF